MEMDLNYIRRLKDMEISSREYAKLAMKKGSLPTWEEDGDLLDTPRCRCGKHDKRNAEVAKLPCAS